MRQGVLALLLGTLTGAVALWGLATLAVFVALALYESQGGVVSRWADRGEALLLASWWPLVILWCGAVLALG